MSKLDSSIVGVAAPEPDDAVVKAHKDALAAREARVGNGRATGAALLPEIVALSIEEAGRLSERGTAAVDCGLDPTS